MLYCIRKYKYIVIGNNLYKNIENLLQHIHKKHTRQGQQTTLTVDKRGSKIEWQLEIALIHQVFDLLWWQYGKFEFMMFFTLKNVIYKGKLVLQRFSQKNVQLEMCCMMNQIPNSTMGVNFIIKLRNNYFKLF